MAIAYVYLLTYPFFIYPAPLYFPVAGVLAPGAHLPPDKEGRSTMHWIMASPNEAGSTKCLGLLLKNALTAEVVDPLDLQGK